MRFYPEDTLERFQFDEVKELLIDLCGSLTAKEWAKRLRPTSNIEKIRTWLAQSNEFLTILKNGDYFPNIRFQSILEHIKTLGIRGAVLDEKAFVEIKNAVITTNEVIHFLRGKKHYYPELNLVIQDVPKNDEIVKKIDKILDEHDHVRSNASKDLDKIRTELITKRARANRQFINLIRKYKNLGWLVDFNEGFANERRVLAVLSEYKREVSGIMHGSSESGKVTFIEPGSNVELNNEIFSLVEQERREVYRILKELTADLTQYIPILKVYEHCLTSIDFTRAKGLLALKINALKPGLSVEKRINLKNAFHPLLFLQNQKEKKKTIPMSIELNEKQRVVVISGPNAGGKSVSLKTVGLLQIMAQCGLLIPAEEESVVGVFDQLLVDIGDDQSIEYELSTYSSRLIKMKYFLENLNENSLFLIDEFGTGSDPELGGAVAETILQRIHELKTFGVVTTHYSNIKLLAHNSDAMENACMLFDQRNLEPRYELAIGQPGSSFTFEVAKKIGLEKQLIADAKQKVNSKKIQLDKLIVKLQKEQNGLREMQEKYAVQKKESEIVEQEFTALKSKLDEKAKVEADRRVEMARIINFGTKYESLLEDWQKTRDKRAIKKKISSLIDNEIAKILDKEKREIEEKEARTKEKRRRKAKRVATIIIKVGDRVKLKDAKRSGVVEEIKGDKAIVLFDAFKFTVPLDDLVFISHKPHKS